MRFDQCAKAIRIHEDASGFTLEAGKEFIQCVASWSNKDQRYMADTWDFWLAGIWVNRERSGTREEAQEYAVRLLQERLTWLTMELEVALGNSSRQPGNPAFLRLWRFAFACAGQGMDVGGLDASDLCQAIAEAADHPDGVVAQMDDWNERAAKLMEGVKA